MKLNQLRALVAVYEERSFTAAAKRVNATQSGLSMHIKDMELRLNTQLFKRSSTGVTPTSAGETLYKRATTVLREINAMENDIAAMAGQVSGTVRVGVMPTFARSVLAPVIDRISKSHPLVEVMATEAYSAVLSTEVARGELDMAIVPQGPQLSGLRGTHFATDIEVLVTSPETDREHLSPVRLGNLGPLKLALPGPANARRGRIESYLKTYGVPIHSIMELDTMMATLDLVRMGEWCSILPGCLCLPEFDDPVRKLHPIVEPQMTVDYILIEPIAKARTPALQAFSTELITQIQDTCAYCKSRVGDALPDAV